MMSCSKVTRVGKKIAKINLKDSIIMRLSKLGLLDFKTFYIFKALIVETIVT